MKEFSQQSFFGSVLFAIVSLFAIIMTSSQVGMLFDDVGNLIYSALLPDSSTSLLSGILLLIGVIALYFICMFIVLYLALSVIVYEATEVPKRRLLLPVSVILALGGTLVAQYLLSFVNFSFDVVLFLIFVLVVVLLAYSKFPLVLVTKLKNGLKVWSLVFLAILLHSTISIVVFLLLKLNPYSTFLGTVLDVIRYALYVLGLHVGLIVAISNSWKKIFAWKYVQKTLIFVIAFIVVFVLGNLLYALPAGRMIFAVIGVLAISAGFVYYVYRLRDCSLSKHL